MNSATKSLAALLLRQPFPPFAKGSVWRAPTHAVPEFLDL